MTREDRWIVSLDEIRALRWECPGCHVALSFALDQTIRLPSSCPSCGADALDPSHPDARTAADFIRALKSLRQEPRTGTLRLEFLAAAGPDRER
jgi:hypothetical protein